MKKKKSDITIRELFRKKLEFAEVAPDPMLRSKIMKRAARQNFLHFNPGSFNIFYLGGIVAASGLIAGLLLTGNHPDTDKQTLTLNPPVNESKYLEVHSASAIRKIPAVTSLKIRQDSAIETSFKTTGSLTANKKAENQDINSAIPVIIYKSIPKNVTISHDTTEKELLQSQLKTAGLVIDPQISAGCAPLKVKFHFNYENFDSCRWTFGDGGTSNLKNPVHVYGASSDLWRLMRRRIRSGYLMSRENTG